jgi:alkylation response protein AidB-like acyl-CoA dehydrogenase
VVQNSFPGLDFGLGGDIDMLRDTVRAFAQNKIAPHAAEIDRANSGRPVLRRAFQSLRQSDSAQW